MAENAASATAAVVESGSGDTGLGRFRGVRMRKWGKWVAEVRLPNSRERIWLGSYDTQDKAARAYDAAVFCLRGPGARFNFPDDPPAIPSARSLTPAQIQVAASRFAHAKVGDVHHAPAMPLAIQEVRDREGSVGGTDHDAEQSSSNWPVPLADSFIDAEEDSDPLGVMGPAPFGGYSEVDGGIFYAGNHQKAEDEEADIDDDEGGAFYQPSGPLWNF